MLSFTNQGTGQPTLVMMPFIGGSWHEYTKAVELLRTTYQCIGIDTPGFGDSRDQSGYSIEEMVQQVTQTLNELSLKRFVLVGHSMSGKVAAVLARRAADGDARLAGLEALVLVAPSASAPDPVPDDIRKQLLAMFSGTQDRKDAKAFFKMGIANHPSSAAADSAVDDLLRMNKAAWQYWWEKGSKEDWSERVGNLDLPVLVIAGDKDISLGPKVQTEFSLPHWSNGRMETIDAGHLIPIDAPEELANAILKFVDTLPK